MCKQNKRIVTGMAAFKKAPSTGYYGPDGGVMPVFSCGASALAPSLLTGDGSHMSFWCSFVLHVVALCLNISANLVFFTSSQSTNADLAWSWALFSLIAHTTAVVGTLVYTGFVRSPLDMPNVLVLGIGLFFGAIVATGHISYAHSGFAANSAENVLYNLSVAFQVFAMASILVNSMCVAAKSGGI